MQEKGLRQSALKTVRAVESKIGEARIQLKVLKARFVDGVNRTIKGFKEKGTLAVYQTIDFLGIRKGLQAVKMHLHRSIESADRGIAKKSYEKLRERSRGQSAAERIGQAGENASALEPEQPSIAGQSSLPGNSSMSGKSAAADVVNPGMERWKRSQAKEQIFNGQKIKMKPDRRAGLQASSSRSVKTAPRIVNTKFPDSSTKQFRAGRGVM